MALRPLVSKLRLLLFPPVALFKFLLELVCGRGFGLLALLFDRLNLGAQRHLWRPLTIARRWTLSRPLWQPEDTLRNPLFQPFTAAQREVAAADPRLRRVDCPCGRKNCDFPHGAYVPNVIIPVGLQDLIRSEVAKVNPGVEVRIERDE